jgi:hypothetical protein
MRQVRTGTGSAGLLLSESRSDYGSGRADGDLSSVAEQIRSNAVLGILSLHSRLALPVPVPSVVLRSTLTLLEQNGTGSRAAGRLEARRQ